MQTIIKICITIYIFLSLYLRISLENQCKTHITKTITTKTHITHKIITRLPTCLLQTHAFYTLGFHYLNWRGKILH